MDTTTIDPAAARPAPDLVARYRAAGHWRARTVLDDIEGWVADTPDGIAVVAITADGAERSVTYREFGSAVERHAAGLTRLGVGPGDVVSTWLPSRWELGALLLACWRIGAVASPMMPTFGPREVERMTARVGSRVVVTAGDDHATALAAMAARLPALRHQIVLDGVPGPGQHAFTDLLDDPVTTPAPRATDPDAVSTIVFTSGTTGEPKAVLHSLNTHLAGGAYLLGEQYPVGPGSVTYCPHTLSHIAGSIMFLSTAARGATAVVTEQWDPAVAASVLERFGVTTFLAAPIYFQQLLDVLPAHRATSLRDVFSTAVTPPRALVEEITRRWGIPVRGIWGMSEVTQFSTRPDDPPDRPMHSIGEPPPGLEVELRTDGTGTASPERPGRMHVRGPYVCLAVAERDGASLRRVADHDDGWYDTGDLVAPDGDGGYRIVGRTADRVGGSFMIPVGDVEDALREHPAVADVVMIETPGDTEPVPCVVVAPTPGAAAPTLDELRSFLLDRDMTEWFLPQRVEVLDALPRNAMGKVQKAVLRERYAAPAAAR